MGYLLVEGKFSASLSRHNSLKDKLHNVMWLDFIERVQALSEREEYKDISILVTADEGN
jgi:hypothetical protein